METNETMKPIPGLERVKPIEGERFCYEVQSSEPDKRGPYRVDKSSWNGSGACSCIGFCGQIQPRLGKGNWEGKTTCSHIDLVDRWYSCTAARRAIEELQKLTKKPYNASEPNL